MADNNKLSPEVAQQLIDAGMLSPEVGSKFAPTAEPTLSPMATPEDNTPVSAADVLMPVEQMQIGDPNNIPQEVNPTTSDLLQRKYDEISSTRGTARTVGGGEFFPKTEIPAQSDDQLMDQAEKEVYEEMKAEQAAKIADEERKAFEKDKAIEARIARRERAKELGIQLKPDPLDDIIDAEEAAKAEAAMAPILEQQAQEEAQMQEQKNAEAQLRAQQAQIDAQKAAELKQAQKEAADAEIDQKEQEVLQTNAEAKVEAAKKSGSSNFWKNLGFILMAGISGGAAQVAGQKGNPFLDAYNDTLKREADALADSKKEAIEIQKLGLKQAAQAIDSNLKMAKTAQAQQALEAGYQKIKEKYKELNGEQKLLDLNLKGQGLSLEEYERLVTDPEARKEYVKFQGKQWRTNDKASAAKVRDIVLPITKKSMRNLAKLRQIMTSDFMAKTPLTREGREARAIAQQDAQTLLGTLRLELFGPGVLTAYEQAQALKRVIPDPSKLENMIFSDKGLSTIDNLMGNLDYSTRATMDAAGANIPRSPQLRRLELLKKAHPEIPDVDLVNSLIKQGLWYGDEY